MKDLLTDWIVNLTFFSILSSMMNRLLPGKSYMPYIRIFCGMIMILIFLNPIFELTGLEKEIEYHFMENAYEARQYEIEKELIQIEEEQRLRWEQEYEQYLKEYEKGEE